MPLEFEEFECGDLLFRCERANTLFSEKPLHILGRAVRDYPYVIVPGPPWVLQQLTSPLLVEGRQPVPQPVQGVTQWRSPCLVPFRLPASFTATVPPPALDSVGATPGGLFEDFHFIGRWM